jgi:cytochrome c oxidase subunit 2
MESYEKLFLGLSVVVLIGVLAAIFWSVGTKGITLPGPYQRVDPATLSTTPPFDNPGLRQVGDNEYEVVMRAKIWNFAPNEVEVPAGAKVRFLISSEDVIHGFRIMNVPINVMLIPGEVSMVEHTFDEPGEYTYVCHEYCGAGHQAMFGTIHVTAPTASGSAAAEELASAGQGGNH